MSLAFLSQYLKYSTKYLKYSTKYLKYILKLIPLLKNNLYNVPFCKV